MYDIAGKFGECQTTNGTNVSVNTEQFITKLTEKGIPTGTNLKNGSWMTSDPEPDNIPDYVVIVVNAKESITTEDIIQPSRIEKGWIWDTCHPARKIGEKKYVDINNFPILRSTFQLFKKKIKTDPLVVVTKIDCISAEHLETLKKELNCIIPSSRTTYIKNWTPQDQTFSADEVKTILKYFNNIQKGHHISL